MTPEEYRNRPTTFGIPRPPVEPPPWDWESAIVDAVGEDLWMARKFIAKLHEHKRKHPASKVERVAGIFIDAPPKFRARYCYEEISSFTKSIQKARSLASWAASSS